jgi:LytR cell envelope-related transcriptional attenuator
VESTYASTLPATRWRTATLAVSLLAALELAALLAIGVAVVGKSVAHRVREAAIDQVAGTAVAAKKPARAGSPQLTRADTDVLVLNGGGVSGAAAQAAEKLRRHGYLIGGVGNAPRASATGKTLVMYSGSYRPEAIRLAKDLHVRAVAPLDGIKQGSLMGAQLVLLVGR